MIAVPLIFGRLTAADYEDAVAADPVWAIASTISATTSSASKTRSSRATITIPKSAPSPTRCASNWRTARSSKRPSNIPIGHKRRRNEGMPLLIEKFKRNLARRFASEQQQRILDASMDRSGLEQHAGQRLRRSLCCLIRRQTAACNHVFKM